MSEVGLNLHNWDGNDYLNEPTIIFDNCNIYGHYSAVITNFKHYFAVHDRFDFINCNLPGGVLFMNIMLHLKNMQLKWTLAEHIATIYDNGNYAETSIIDYPTAPNIFKLKNVGGVDIHAVTIFWNGVGLQGAHWGLSNYSMPLGIEVLKNGKWKLICWSRYTDIPIGEIGAIAN